MITFERDGCTVLLSLRIPYRGLHGRPGELATAALSRQGMPWVVLLVERAANKGASITNSPEEAAMAAVRAMHEHARLCPGTRFYEAYEYRMKKESGYLDPAVSASLFTPEWRHVGWENLSRGDPAYPEIEQLSLLLGRHLVG